MHAEFNSLLVHRNYKVVVAEHVVALCPCLDAFIIDAILALRLLGERWEEMCIKEIYLINRHIECFEQVSRLA